MEYKYQFNLALIDYNSETDKFNLHHEQITSLRNQLINVVMPWLDTGPTDLRDYVESARQQYIETFGDPADPEFQKEIEKTCAFLRRGTTDEHGRSDS